MEYDPKHDIYWQQFQPDKFYIICFKGVSDDALEVIAKTAADNNITALVTNREFDIKELDKEALVTALHSIEASEEFEE